MKSDEVGQLKYVSLFENTKSKHKSKHKWI